MKRSPMGDLFRYIISNQQHLDCTRSLPSRTPMSPISSIQQKKEKPLKVSLSVLEAED